MEIWQRISINGPGYPFSKKLPISSDAVIRTMQRYGFDFEEFGENKLNYDAQYKPEVFEEVQQIVFSEKWDVVVTRQFWHVWNDDDYNQAPLWNTHFPDLWIDEIDFASTCDECGRKRIKVDTNIRVSEVKSKKPLHSVNGQFKIVSAEVKSAIANSLVGACFYPFDQQEQYFYLGAMCNLGPLVIHDDEVIGYTGDCPRCKLPKFTTFFGPLRYAGSRWSGEDVVQESFHDGFLFTPRAFELLRTFDRGLGRDGIALLE